MVTTKLLCGRIWQLKVRISDVFYLASSPLSRWANVAVSQTDRTSCCLVLNIWSDINFCLASIEIPLFNLVGLLVFQNLIWPKVLNYDNQTSHFVVVVTLTKKGIHRFTATSLGNKVFLGPSASRDVVITQFDHLESWPQSLMLFLGATPTATIKKRVNQWCVICCCYSNKPSLVKCSHTGFK